jgi:hypothetical protein
MTSIFGFFLALAISSPGLAQANPTVAFELRLSGSSTSRVDAPFYQINDRDCRAWLAVNIHDPRGAEIGGEVAHRDSGIQTRGGLVQEMTFNCTTREIHWNGLHCATAGRSSDWNANSEIRPTGLCHLSQTSIQSFDDNGFRRTPVQVIQVRIERARR